MAARVISCFHLLLPAPAPALAAATAAAAASHRMIRPLAPYPPCSSKEGGQLNGEHITVGVLLVQITEDNARGWGVHSFFVSTMSRHLGAGHTRRVAMPARRLPVARAIICPCCSPSRTHRMQHHSHRSQPSSAAGALAGRTVHPCSSATRRACPILVPSHLLARKSCLRP